MQFKPRCNGHPPRTNCNGSTRHSTGQGVRLRSGGALLEGAGVRHGFINLGGDVRTMGAQPDGAPSRFGIRHPRENSALLTSIAMRSGAVATSGDYARCINADGVRYGHILNPMEGHSLGDQFVQDHTPLSCAMPLESRPMSNLRRHQRMATWASLLVLVLAMLAPTVSRAVAFANADLSPWAEVCSANMSRADDASSRSSGGLVHVLDHCPLCSIASDVPGVPPAPLTWSVIAPHGHLLPNLFLEAPRTLHVWVSTQPRAPPSFS